MYRVGLGECFLLTFPRLGVPFHMLINCGAIMGTPDAGFKMRAIVSDILATTNGHLDVVVATHLHWDKLSGFVQAQDIFKEIRVSQVWLGWTEDPLDPDARINARSSLRKGPGDALRQNESAVRFLRETGEQVRYWSGGDGPVALSGVAGARIFFLGPPRMSADLSEALSNIEGPRDATPSPFDGSYQISREAAATHPVYAAYFSSAGTEAVEWRQISRKSLASIPHLVINREAAANNTSLVMAIELIGAHGESKVLLFAGDAQLESWFSWHEHRWPADAPPDDPKTITSRKLLERTVLYKVSHYGSWNGTPRQFGLEMMKSPELTAMIVVDEGMAKKKMWRLPAPELMAVLERKTRGRIIRSDRASVPEAGGLSGPEHDQFHNSVHVSDLYIDYFVSIPQLTAAEREKSAANWTAANERRVYLVDKKLAGTIRPEEEAELREIEQLMDEYLRTTAPTGLGLIEELRKTVEEAKRSAPRR
jgi:hypothetical protein